MTRTKSITLVILIFGFVLAACSAQATQVQPTSAPTQIIEPVSTPAAGNLPLTEADVPRISLEEAKTALDSGAAIVVDVRPPGDFEASHVAGAINIPLLEIERNPAGLTLDKEQWVITYCT